MDRCQQLNGNKVCNNPIPCALHTRKNLAAQKKQYTYDLMETEYARDLAKNIHKKSSDPELLNMRKDLAVLQLLVEKTLNSCQSDVDFLLRKDELSNLLSRMESMKKTAMAIEKDSGLLMTLDEAVELGQTLLNIVTTTLKNHNMPDDVLSEIADAFEAAIYDH